ncbi:protein of unknown function DUF952 [Emticicia oligotrophica DSM 17448]|uniref:DUF952 domain-containing protein n=1 Tax=Emticicia oligotrophica (strain DSM 17448 / CIP 109782 / MTCC 6937 / GPTSA100-15) TaxID=929562 RepID=A0ABN4ASQ7_EMTOG|nr:MULTISPECIES: DUF952 domain-containing protein [Emticicia]AFK04761.1 protein of unknown function DUF952 [Emticicia oligotrophica DSM 17448]
MAIIYHITPQSWFDKFEGLDYYESPTFNEETFIHLSTSTQVAGVLERYYVGQTNLIKLHVDTEKLTAELKYELATNNEYFPHLYGRLNKNAVLEVEKI